MEAVSISKKSLTQNVNVQTALMKIMCAGILTWLVLRNIGSATSIYVIGDEFGYWGVAAQLAGLDWSESLGTVYYYSYGYSLLLAPILLIFKNPTLCYQAAIVLNAVLYIASFFIVIYCGKSIFDKTDKRIITLCAFAAMLYPNTLFQTQIAWAETFLTFLFICQLALLISIFKHSNIFNVCAFVFVGIYQYVTHQRTLGILIVTFIVLLLLFIAKKIKISAFIAVIVLAAALLAAHSFIKYDLMNTVWTPSVQAAAKAVEADTVANVGNDYASSFSKILMLAEPGKLTAMLQEFAGQLLNLFAGSLLMFFVGITFFIRKFFEKPSKRTILSDSRILSFFIVAGIAFSLIISCISMYGYGTRVDTLVYGRYVESCVPPVVLFALLYIFQQRENKKDLLCICAGGALITVVLGFVSDNSLTNYIGESFNVLCSVCMAYFYQNKYTFLSASIIVSIICIFAVMLILAASQKKQKRYMCIAVLAFAVTWIYIAENSGRQLLSIRENSFSQKTIEQTQHTLDKYKELDWYIDYKDADVSKRMIVGHIQYLLPDLKISIYSDATLKNAPSSLLAPLSVYQENDKLRKEYAFSIPLVSSTVLLKRDFDSTPYSVLDMMMYSQDITLLTKDIDGVDGVSLKRGDMQYGPYITLRKGTYSVKITGDKLRFAGCRVTYNNGENNVELQDIKKSDKEITYTVVITDEECSNAEFILEAQRDNIVIEDIVVTKKQ